MNGYAQLNNWRTIKWPTLFSRQGCSHSVHKPTFSSHTIKMWPIPQFLLYHSWNVLPCFAPSSSKSLRPYSFCLATRIARTFWFKHTVRKSKSISLPEGVALTSLKGLWTSTTLTITKSRREYLANLESQLVLQNVNPSGLVAHPWPW